ncbi:phenoloxidase-activating factor 2-like [Wyeomyia smithii]|uniref:phenoloxidase-activating factor 2-like n=1 Tax=Wyeomyia smithii TaxID=174621 RepID=UPI002467E546|nr:phenoloxidase-activating factor 2-like [Wyeomyia smithii]XP_055528986.1 phenoloxidase-activating factor 2-like [Wyeomyia smithii]XP_055528987.1 phenoloxidase-activating factor 2-like [Wyeomyia smithii]XP_055528988.1 phenoloxidase-activating factor 2-like [Wyeomyia smithii]XP_055528989.1 phenoloxidase-activating factor 2-like [Wyeomyia smithii]XP_055528991.1 phenoloxidase-activating factor 2-like [Wyeomyia smithii]
MRYKFLFIDSLVVVLTVFSRAQNDLDALDEHEFNTKNDFEAAAITTDPTILPTPVAYVPKVTPPVNTCNGTCVPYYLCKGNKIITNGTGLIDIRMGGHPTVVRECPNYMEVCCEKEKVLDKAPSTATKSPPTANKYTCGGRNADGSGFRIAGHENGESEYGEFPWMLAVLREDEFFNKTLIVYEFGGSLIAPNVVLTVAHCVVNKREDTLLVRAGEWDTQTTNELYPHQDRRVREVIAHDQYKKETVSNSIALLVLEQPFDLTENIQPVCLPPKNFNFDGSSCFAMGWGKDIFGKKGEYQVILKKLQLPIVPQNQCVKALRTTRLGPFFLLHQSFICAGGEKGVDTCRGDGGSSLVCPIPGVPTNYYQAGIVAWGIGCGKQGIPGIYVNVSMFREWIDQQLTQRNVESKHYTYT